MKEMKFSTDDLPDQDEISKLIGRMEDEQAVEKLAKEYEAKMNETSSAKSKASKKAKKAAPAWAKSEKQLEEEKEKEIDDLLEFAYDLDYDKFMEDFEIR
jgi:uncharacterized protein YdiU (UPF0061 family)